MPECIVEMALDSIFNQYDYAQINGPPQACNNRDGYTTLTPRFGGVTPCWYHVLAA